MNYIHSDIPTKFKKNIKILVALQLGSPVSCVVNHSQFAEDYHTKCTHR